MNGTIDQADWFQAMLLSADPQEDIDTVETPVFLGDMIFDPSMQIFEDSTLNDWIIKFLEAHPQGVYDTEEEKALASLIQEVISGMKPHQLLEIAIARVLAQEPSSLMPEVERTVIDINDFEI